MVDVSPWPLMGSVGAMLLTTGLVKWFSSSNMTLALIGLVSILAVMYQWWRDVVRESTFQGLHTMMVMKGLKWGVILFITSEVLFFFSFFWAFFHSTLSPTVEIGVMWPPMGIVTFNPFSIPLLNTLILLTSGATVTWAHHTIIEKNYSSSITALTLTCLLGLYFTALQAMEYWEAPFSIADSIYGTTFFVATGFHGLHVIIGTLFLIVCLYRLKSLHFSDKHHLGFESAAWYWHFVDVVWLFLYIFIYWWGG
uniref:Cytochrome c oxidase subunit 3 n=1 Tax=Neomysis awatschensis TaxID=1049545 RepID=A0A6M3TWS3_9CRUS|nr:cytochrome c oxidase subunit 3 [Neomysis awatschensis]